MKVFPQLDEMDCGPSCLAMIANYYGKKYDISFLRDHCFLTREGVSLLNISDVALELGFKTICLKSSIKVFNEKSNIPCILHWDNNHFVVLYKVKKKLFSKNNLFYIADPSYGKIVLKEDSFKEHWINSSDEGVALFLEPTEEFYKKNPKKIKKINLRYLLNFLKPYTKQLLIISFLIILGSGISLIFPFLTQNLIDRGVQKNDLHFVTIILLSQLSLYLGSISVEIIRNWITLFMGTKLSISIISNFLKRLLELPIHFFETKQKGDFHQRILDNERIEYFLTSQSLFTFFSIITFFIYFGVLWYYNSSIIFIYIFLTIISIFWSFYWLKKRKILDFFLFHQRSKNQNSIHEIIDGVSEMKLNLFEDFKRKEWENIQKELFKINIRSLKNSHLQGIGFDFFNQVKNILITFISATLVINNKMTLGELLSVSYIIGQMNSPVSRLVEFFRSLQDAKLSLERLSEVENIPAEENPRLLKLSDKKNKYNNIKFINVSFQYQGPKSPFVLKNINLEIPYGKVTAIVGASGSGKTTLLKLLLKFYSPTQGSIFYDNLNINSLSAKNLRENSGVVMQDGFIFSDSIARNIATSDTPINKIKLKKSIKISNIQSFIDSLPLGLNTKIGASGNGISGGQKQRILIARAVYKNPKFLFFDEATSSLDAENEKIIYNQLQSFFKGKTVVIIAHRLSTVKNADKIIVLKKGEIIEQGNHKELVSLKKEYYSLIKNQLELG
ncbi:leukotoxin translocation ATP-binding protein LktB [Capnocytophaga ochracea]|uniref:Leukotoxin translocation ATP-binding protein LktB n=1 Tax=Capnocytophaga ochracea TaxID=1018 RepID=A0A7Z9CB05_CAPOC|nr:MULTISPECIES: peptidase domain-containing ABC transporter [Capnocytophaga]EIW94065.1 peptidase, C39 family [Capnocytophaga sp. oral taxon 412 str. F0487]VDG81200.1 leukotoxin translocation ATP-binding protein LktB [Capnocytophaga ochracea]